jgi:uncharacterized protein
MEPWTRRRFLVTSAAAVLTPRIGSSAVASEDARIVARPFPPGAVRLLPGPLLDAAEVNRRYLAGLDTDRLLHTFRTNAGLPSSAQPLGGWEAPDNELRGHFTGHYLTACALASAGTGDAVLAANGRRTVSALAECQSAVGTGYLSAFPDEFFARLRAGERVWAPFYTLHKIMAGLYDQYALTGNRQALEVLRGIADWTCRWASNLDDAQMARILDVEFGGMNDVLYTLAAETNEPSYRELAHRFDHERIFGPLAEGRDQLRGLHVNTQIPKVIGAARRYETIPSADPRARAIASYFWTEVVSKRSYATGGTSNEEEWRTDPGKLAAELGVYTQECCCTYNMLKLTRHVFGWTADPACAEYAERALFNGILGTQHPSDGAKLYYVPLGSGWWKYFGTPLADFWCCTGTGAESFAKLGELAYFHDASGVWVNLFVASELSWPRAGLSLRQETRFPEEPSTRLKLRLREPRRLALRLRIPGWAGRGEARVNGTTYPGETSRGYLVIDRTWNDGDRVDWSFPMALRAVPMPDDPTLAAVAWGPVVLAGRLGKEGLTPATIRAEPTKPRTVPELTAPAVPAPDLAGRVDRVDGAVRRVPGPALRFEAATKSGGKIELVPLNSLYDERYAVYWRFAG